MVRPFKKNNLIVKPTSLEYHTMGFFCIMINVKISHNNFLRCCYSVGLKTKHRFFKGLTILKLCIY